MAENGRFQGNDIYDRFLSINLGQGMTYSIDTTMGYLGPSRDVSILSSCLWFYNDANIKDYRFFLYDNSDTFEFGYSDYTSFFAAVMSSHNAKYVFLYRVSI